MKHTPTPWGVCIGGNIWGDAGTHMVRVCTTDVITAESYRQSDLEEKLGNADFIVKAVNEHAKLSAQNKRLKEAGLALIELSYQSTINEDSSIFIRLGIACAEMIKAIKDK